MAKSKKDKAQAENQEINNSEEHVPPTIVEGSMEEVFASPEIVNEQPAPARQKVSKRPYIDDVEILLSAGTLTKKAMLEFIMEKYPAVSKGGASTFLTAAQSEIQPFQRQSVVKTETGKLVFKDKLEAPACEVQPAAESGEHRQNNPNLGGSVRSRLGLGNIHNQKKGEHCYPTLSSHCVISRSLRTVDSMQLVTAYKVEQDLQESRRKELEQREDERKNTPAPRPY